jgi:hypothetical protein
MQEGVMMTTRGTQREEKRTNGAMPGHYYLKGLREIHTMHDKAAARATTAVGRLTWVSISRIYLK